MAWRSGSCARRIANTRLQAFAAVMLDEPFDLPNGCGDLGLAEYYERRGPALKAGGVLRMKTGEPASPREVWVRKGIGATGLPAGGGLDSAGAGAGGAGAGADERMKNEG
ncbi:hypothetical protein HZB60_11675 [candidate division KSB1 bacterium]|nr:hypothetical protein [candidate division KSB1 bacterium]